LGHVTRKTVSEMTYNVSSGTLLYHTYDGCRQVTKHRLSAGRRVVL